MANQSTTKSNNLTAGFQSSEKLRQQFIDAPMEAAIPSVLATLGELSDFMRILPEAFAASQRRELERVKRSASENDPRVKALETSIEQTEVLQTTVRRGQIRVQRGLATFGGREAVFHGFVSDPDLKPIAGVTVRLINAQSTSGRGLSAITDDDGYFRISLGTKAVDKQDAKVKAGSVSISQRLEDLADRLSRPPSVTATNPDAEKSRVEILLKGKLLHSDPEVIIRDDQSVYREYVIAEPEISAARTGRSSLSRVAVQTSTKQEGPLAAEAAKEEAGASEQASAAAPRAEKKSSKREKKPRKPSGKK